MQNNLDIKINFGKYKGLKIKKLKDKEYTKWLIDNYEGDDLHHKEVIKILKELNKSLVNNNIKTINNQHIQKIDK